MLTDQVFVSGEVQLDVSVNAARARLLSLIRGGALLTASQHAYGDAVTGLSRPGQPGPGPATSRLVEAKFREPVNHGDSVVLALRWEAIGPDGGLFPALDADITLAAAGNGATSLRLAGAYRPPMDAAGPRPDRATVHRVATATIQGFLGRIGVALASSAPVTGPSTGPVVETGHVGPAWRPPETEVS